MNIYWHQFRLQIWSTLLWYFIVQSLFRYSVQQQSYKTIDVTAMCSSNSITVQMMFDSPFNGKIYSSRYISVHNCVYYNHYGENMILFTIPIYNCGTVVEKDNQNIIAHIENEIYVQFDKDTQNVDDRRYLFVCDRSQSSSSSLFHGTVRPGQTVIVQTLSPTKVIATPIGVGNGGESFTSGQQQPSIWMEIQEGNSPGRPIVVRRPLQLGDPIVLVVSGRSSRPTAEYDIFVHSCFASDGSGSNKIELTNSNGCTVRSRLAERMVRRKDENNLISYRLQLQAFKFPTTNDVYFSCSVDFCTSCNFPELCSSGSSKNNRRIKRSPVRNFNDSTDLEDALLVHDSVQILDNGDSRKNYSSDIITCFTQLGLAILMSIFSFLTLSLILVTFCTVRFYHLRKSNQTLK